MDKYKKYTKPVYTFLIACFIWILIFIIPTHKYTTKLTFNLTFLLIIYIISFLLGCFIMHMVMNKNKKKISTVNFKFNIRWIKIINKLAFLGLIIRFYDLIINKNFFNYSSSIDFRSNYIGGEYSILSLFSSILFPMSLLSILIYLLDGKSFNKKIKFNILINIILLLLYSLTLGGRTQITLMLVSIIFIFLYKGNRVKKVASKKRRKGRFLIISISVAIFIVFIIYSNSILEERLLYQGRNTESALIYLEYAHQLKVNENIMSFISTHNNTSYIYTLISLRHYVIHGLYELQNLINTFDLNNIAYGSYEFNPILKVIGLFGGPYKSIQAIGNSLNKTGVYTTFFGPVYVDFGYLGIIFMFIFGFLCTYLWCKSEYDIRAKLLYSLFFSIILHIPFINMIQSGMGLYYILAFIIALYIIPYFIRGGVIIENKQNF